MNRLRWWYRITGAIYILLGIGFIPFINAARLPFMLPGFDAPTGGVAYRGFLDFAFMFGLDLLVVGAMLIYAARKPLQNAILVWLVVWLEIVRGILDDIYMIMRGYSAPFYIGFIALHLVIIVTGVIFLKQARAEQPEPG